MTDDPTRNSAREISPAVLASILDKLTAVDLDLESVTASIAGGQTTPTVVIAGACTILRSAMEDLRDVVHQIDGMTFLLPGAGQNRPE